MIVNNLQHRHSSEWFVADKDTAKQLVTASTEDGKLFRYVPGARAKGPHIVELHRSHLPLLDSRETFQFLDEKSAQRWADRQARFTPLGVELRTTQHQAIEYIEPRRGTLLGDDMRLGKTLTSLASHDPARGPLVVVAPKSTRAVWLGWMRRLWPDEPIGVGIGTKFDKAILTKKLIFIHYEIAAKWQALFKIGTLVLDEAHYLTNKDSKRSQACVLLASRAEMVIAATGTPIYTRPIDLWNILGTIAPGAWGNYYEFGDRYCGPQETAYGRTFEGVSNSVELKARLGEVMIRRLWKDAHKDLPPIQRSIVVADIDQRLRMRLDVIAGKLRNERTNTSGLLAHYRLQLAAIKMKTVLREINKIYECREPQVIWTWHKEAANDLAKALRASDDYLPGDVFIIHGDIPSDRRDQEIAAWRECPTGILISTIAVAQVGIDLSHAHLGTFAEIDHVPTVIAQAEMRTYDPTRSMSITYVVADHVVDQRIARSLISKLSSADPLGLGAATDAIEAIRVLVEGPQETADMSRFLDDLFASGIE